MARCYHDHDRLRRTSGGGTQSRQAGSGTAPRDRASGSNRSRHSQACWALSRPNIVKSRTRAVRGRDWLTQQMAHAVNPIRRRKNLCSALYEAIEHYFGLREDGPAPFNTVRNDEKALSAPMAAAIWCRRSCVALLFLSYIYVPPVCCIDRDTGITLSDRGGTTRRSSARRQSAADCAERCRC